MALREIRLKPALPWQQRLEDAVAGPARFIVAVMGRRAGKTSGCARIAGKRALRGATVFWGAPTHDTATIGRDKFHSMFGNVIEHQTQIPANADILGGGRILWRSFDRPGAAIGRAIDLAVVDEGARVKKRVIYEDLLPTIADTGGKIVVPTTPRGRQSWVFDWYTRAMAGDPNYAVVHGPSTENPDPNVAEFVQVAKENMPDVLYRQEIMAEFVEGEGAVFHHISDNATLDGWLDGPREGCHYVVGADLAKHQDWTVMYALDVRSGEVHGCERFQHLDWPMVKARIEVFAKRWGASVWLDATGVGDPIFDDLAVVGLNVIPVKFTSESKSQLVISLMNAMEKGEVKYPRDDALIAELEAFAYEELPSGKFRYSAPDGKHDDCVMALALAVWGKNRATTDFGGWVA